MELDDLRRLPEPVLRRLQEHDLDVRTNALSVVRSGAIIESRVSNRVEIRRDSDGNPTLDGYATVYEHAYPVAGGPPYGWNEVIAAGACAKSVREKDDVRLLVNHDGIALGRTRSGTLTLASDEIGLACTSLLDARSPLVQTLASAMDRADMDEMSFAFQALRSEWSPDYLERRITEVKVFDVSVVTYPANPATVAQLRGTDDLPARPAGVPLSLAQAQRYQLSLRAR